MRERIRQDCPINCGSRHSPGHPHLSMSPDQITQGASDASPEAKPSAAPAVTGAAPGTLGEQAKQALGTVRRRRGSARARSPEEIEEEKKQAEARLNFCAELVKMEATVPVLVTGDERWYTKMTEKRIATLAQSWSNLFEAYGIRLAGPATSIGALLLTHFTIGRELYAEIAAEPKPEEEKKPEVVN